MRPLQQWLVAHPLVSWLWGHPLWTLAVVIAALLLFAGLWSAIARLTEGFWLGLVRLPFWLTGRLWGAVVGLLTQRRAHSAAVAEDRLREIMGRLEVLQTEQEALLAEMRTLLNSHPPSP
jgi:hypothetical protein